jgi:RNA polymerase sigma factor (sigma-70 family)
MSAFGILPPDGIELAPVPTTTRSLVKNTSENRLRPTEFKLETRNVEIPSPARCAGSWYVHCCVTAIRRTRRAAKGEAMLIPWFQPEVSIEECSGGNGSLSFETRLVDPATESQEQKMYRQELVDGVRRALFSLDARERHIISSRFGLFGGEERSLADIATGLEVSRERVRQIEVRAKTKLRAELSWFSPSEVSSGR